MVVKFPDSTKDITLEQMQSIGNAQNKPIAFFEEILKIKNPTEIFRMQEINAAFNTFEHMLYLDVNLHKNKLPEMGSEVIGGYYLPPHILDIRVKHFIEIVNAEVSEENYQGLDIYAGCFYRKDWDKGYSKTEMIETGNYFLKKPFYYSAITSFLVRHLMEMIEVVFPILKTRQADDPVDDGDDVRKAYEMLDILAGIPIHLEAAGNMILVDALGVFERQKKKMIKDRLETAQRKS